MAGLTRYTRSSMLDVMRQDYIRTARAKGFREQSHLQTWIEKRSDACYYDLWTHDSILYWRRSRGGTNLHMARAWETVYRFCFFKRLSRHYGDDCYLCCARGRWKLNSGYSLCDR